MDRSIHIHVCYTYVHVYMHTYTYICVLFTESCSMDYRVTCLILSYPQEKVKAVFDNLIQLEHLNIVKFHKYWADVKENRARVRSRPRRSVFSIRLLFMFGFLLMLFFCSGHFHHGVHVIREPQTVFEKDKEKPQDHE